ncbi:LysR family transcriptional regulator [Exercitatus varius]|uniref:LysR family transcriptional regulator n=1 Tax=Exercitatus varius TaxID=67857 RepID=A0AAW6QDQ6_9PAST|nr:LysR family transcriptional regulator [Exercitatus varius]MDG2941355.1 LysR family transcriptional regulator [Exercitatus varius]MDG2950517.1 LysR family transcriptional regulator [Exercitatus varius]MDG2951240.1 LysR family transcriptional regulator [Exercitatus varius]
MEHARLLIIFANVIKYGSMNAAAPHLGMTASAVSHHIKQLEKFYQIKLLNRTTRQLAPTDAGRLLLTHANQLIDLLDKADDDMHNLRNEPAGRVSITMSTVNSKNPAIQWALVQIHQRYPKIHLVLLENDSVVNLLDENAPDIAIRIIPTPDNDTLIVRPLAEWQTVLCASPDYLRQHSIEKTADLLTAHWLNFHDGVLLNALEHLGLSRRLPENRTDCPNHSITAKELACLGLGVTVMMDGDIQSELANGTLKLVLPQNKLPDRTVYAITATRSQSAKVRAVLDVLKEGFGVG